MDFVLDPIAIYSSVVGTLALFIVVIQSRKRFKVKWEPIIPIIPIIRKHICCVKTREYNIKLTLFSKKGDIIVYSIEQLSSFQGHDSQMSVKDELTNTLIKKKPNYILRIEEGIPIILLITFKLPSATKVPLRERTGLLISSSAKKIKKPFTIKWC